MIENAIRALNEAAVTRTNDVIYMLTEKLMVFGLEWAVVNESAMEQWEKLVPEDIEGALQLRHDIGMHKRF